MNLLGALPRDWADIVVAQPPCADAVDAHDQAAGWVGAGHARVGLHPVGRVVLALLGRQQRDGRLERTRRNEPKIFEFLEKYARKWTRTAC